MESIGTGMIIQTSWERYAAHGEEDLILLEVSSSQTNLWIQFNPYKIPAGLLIEINKLI